jgi:hypothetical protein
VISTPQLAATGLKEGPIIFQWQYICLLKSPSSAAWRKISIKLAKGNSEKQGERTNPTRMSG